VGNGEDASFEGYVARRGPALVRLAYLMVRDHHLAEDLMQESLARLHRHWPRVALVDNPDAYVRRVMLNQVQAKTVAKVNGTARTPDPAVWVLVAVKGRFTESVLLVRTSHSTWVAHPAGFTGCAPK
jgi:hypothetical protein